MTAPRILVIGAGPSGLATARRLQEVGLDYDHVEQHTGIGGLWDIDNPFTPMYESAHFISSKTLSAFPGHPMPEDYPDYPSHRQLAAYLRRFADAHGLTSRVELGTTVTGVHKKDDGTWQVSFAGQPDRIYDAVVAATGMLHTPIVPDLPGDFSGEILHTRDYRNPEVFRGKRVLIVGGGNSGCDIACDAGHVAERAVLSMRRGYWFLPKHLFGMPVDVFGETGPRLPLAVQQRAFAAMLRVLQGDLTKLGLQKPDHKIFETHPLVNSELIHSLQHGDVIAKPGLRSVHDQVVTFTDGSTEEIDLLMWATGYTHTIPVAADYLGGTHMPDLWLQTFSREHAGLLAVGFVETNSAAWSHFDRQARMVAGHLAQWRDDPRVPRAFQKRIANARPDLTGGIRLLATPRHEGYVDTHAFAHLADRAIADMGWPGP